MSLRPLRYAKGLGAGALKSVPCRACTVPRPAQYDPYCALTMSPSMVLILKPHELR